MRSQAIDTVRALDASPVYIYIAASITDAISDALHEAAIMHGTAAV